MTEDEKWINKFMEVANDPSCINKLPCIFFNEQDIEEYYRKSCILKNQNKNYLSSCIKELIDSLAMFVHNIFINAFDMVFKSYVPP